MTSIITRNLTPYNYRTRNTLVNNFSSRQSPPKENAKTQNLFFKTVVLVGTTTGAVIGGGKAYQAVKTTDWKDISKTTVILSGGLAGSLVGAGLGACLGGGIVYLSPFKGAIATIACSTPPLVLSYGALDDNIKTSISIEILLSLKEEDSYGVQLKVS